MAASKTAAWVRQVVLDPELVLLLREHKLAAKGSQPDDFVFAGRIREQPRERNSVRTRILYSAIEKANGCWRPKIVHRYRMASRSTRSAEPTPPSARSLASILRSPPRRWATAIRA